MPFVIVVESRSGANTKEGQKFILKVDREQYVDAEAWPYDGGFFPLDALIFENKEDADEFCRKWKGGYRCNPKSYEVIEVRPRTVMEVVGWRKNVGF